MLKDPVERFFTFEYGITGKWDDPQVRRLNGGDAPAKSGKDKEEAQRVR